MTRSPGPPPATAERLDLSAKEFAVLEALLKASPGALSAERLLEQAWDENTDPFTNTVRVTIGRLKRKLGEPERHPKHTRHRIQTPAVRQRPSLVSHTRPEPDAPAALA